MKMMNSDRQCMCYDMIADAGYERRDWSLDELKKYMKSAELRFELARKIDWENVEEFEFTYDWCITKFFEDAEDFED